MISTTGNVKGLRDQMRTWSKLVGNTPAPAAAQAEAAQADGEGRKPKTTRKARRPRRVTRK